MMWIPSTFTPTLTATSPLSSKNCFFFDLVVITAVKKVLPYEGH